MSKKNSTAKKAAAPKKAAVKKSGKRSAKKKKDPLTEGTGQAWERGESISCEVNEQ